MRVDAETARQWVLTAIEEALKAGVPWSGAEVRFGEGAAWRAGIGTGRWHCGAGEGWDPEGSHPSPRGPRGLQSLASGGPGQLSAHGRKENRLPDGAPTTGSTHRVRTDVRTECTEGHAGDPLTARAAPRQGAGWNPAGPPMAMAEMPRAGRCHWWGWGGS